MRKDLFPTFESAMSLVNSKVPEQREKGLLLLERGEFLQPDSAKHLDAMLAALTHPRTSSSVAIRQNVLRPLPALLHRCGASMRSSFEPIVPHLAERLVDADAGVRTLAARALLELLTVVRASLVVPALLSRAVILKSVRVREAVLTLLAHALHQRDPPPGEELPAACCKEMATLLRQMDDAVSPHAQAALLLAQELHVLSPAAVRNAVASSATQPGVPRGAARHVHARIDEVERGVAPALPPLHVAYPPPPPAPVASDSYMYGGGSTTPGGSLRASMTGYHTPSSARGSPRGTPSAAPLTATGLYSAGSVSSAPGACGEAFAMSGGLDPYSLAMDPPARSQFHPPQHHAPPAVSPLPPSAAAPSPSMSISLPPSVASTLAPAPSSTTPSASHRTERRSLAAAEDEYANPPSPIRIGSAEAATRELREIARELRQPLRLDGVWQERAGAMRRLHAILLGGACRLPSFAHLLHVHTCEPLSLQLRDLRSKCVKLACEVISEASRALGTSYRESAVELLPTLLRVLRVTVGVITDAADGCIRQILRHVRSPKLIPDIVSGVTARDAAPVLRARCCQYVELLLKSYSTSQIDDASHNSIEEAMGKALSDASSEVRTAARAAYVALESRWPSRAARLRDRLPASSQRALPKPAGGATGGGLR